MKSWKRWIAIVCAFALVFGMSPATYAAETAEENTVVSESENDEILESTEEIEQDDQSDQNARETEEVVDEADDEEESQDPVVEEAEPETKDEEAVQPDQSEEKDADEGEEEISIPGEERKEETTNEKKGGVSEKVENQLTFTLDKNSFPYTGAEIKPVPVNVKVVTEEGEVVLTEDQYTVSYANNINVGTGQVTVTVNEGTGYEPLDASLPFTITKVNQVLTVKASKPSLKYGKKGTVTVSGAKGKLTFVSSNKKLLTIDGSGKYTAKATGTVTVTVTSAATANYNAAKKAIKITVTGKKLTSSNTKIKLSKTKYSYNGKKRKPKVTVKYKGKKLKKNKDYKLVYQNNIQAGKAKVIVTGMGKYMGTRKKSFKITAIKNTMKATINKTTIDLNKTAVITVKKAVGKVTYKSSDTRIATVSAKGVVTGKSSGTCTITVKAAGNANYKAKSKKFKITVGYMSLTSDDCKVTLSANRFTYDGQLKMPTVTVKYNGNTLKPAKDYTMTYSNNIDAGTAKIAIKGKGRYINTRIVTFKINKAEQTKFKVKPRDIDVRTNRIFTISASGAIGSISYVSNSPSYVKVLGGGKFETQEKTTNNYVTLTITAKGNKNYKAKSYTVVVRISK